MADKAYSILVRELCLVAKEARVHDIPVIIGGGMGLLLKDQVIREKGTSTLRSYPLLRATSDLDLFLTTEVIVDSSKTEAFRGVLDALGFKPIKGVEFYQFVKALPEGSALPQVKVDLLSSLPEPGNFKADDRRIRPLGYKGLHAHVTPEALTVEEYLMPVSLRCDDSEVEVFVPHSFSYIVMKLFAFRDRRDDPEKQFGRYHSFDIYTALAMMTEEEFRQGQELRARFSDSEQMTEAHEIAIEFFSNQSDLGMIRMREHLRQVGIGENAVSLEEFVRDLHDLFG